MVTDHDRCWLYIGLDWMTFGVLFVLRLGVGYITSFSMNDFEGLEAWIGWRSGLAAVFVFVRVKCRRAGFASMRYHPTVPSLPLSHVGLLSSVHLALAIGHSLGYVYMHSLTHSLWTS
jgi:hypothetical protein